MRNSARRAAIAVLVCLSACSGSPDSARNAVDVRDIIASGDYPTRTIDGMHFIEGPPQLLEFIRRDAAIGKRELEGYLDSPERHVRYFALLGLSMIGDKESRWILKKWGAMNRDKDPSLALLINARLVYMNDFGLVREFRGLDPSRVDSFALSTWLACAKYHLGLGETPGNSDAPGVPAALTRIEEYLDKLLWSYPFLAR